jgi:hypothetical protein
MPNNKKQFGGFWSYLLWLLLMSLALVSTSRGEDRALLIGVGRYAHFDDRLNGVDLDLNMMTEIAQLMGFKKHAIKVLEHDQASTARVYDTVENWLIKGTGPADRILFYFSGHGSQIPDENNDENDQFDEVLLMYDVTLTEKSGQQTLNGVLLDDHFNRMLARMKSSNILVILDACHSGSATRSLKINPQTIPINDAQVKYFYYSPMLEAAGGSGRFDVMESDTLPAVESRYVAITACRDDEKTVTTAQGSIFTLGLREVLRSAARAGHSITPEELQRRTTAFIREQIQSDTAAFHPQIAGQKYLRQRPLKLIALAGGNGFVRKKLEARVNKSRETVWIRLNKTCFEPGDVLEIAVKITEPGYLNVISISADDHATVLFPNQYHPHNLVRRGDLTIPADQMKFELVADGLQGPNLITAFLSQSPINSYNAGFKTKEDVLAELSPNSTRSLTLRQGKDQVASGRVTVEIRGEGQCEQK